MSATVVEPAAQSTARILFTGDEVEVPGLAEINRDYLADESECVNRLVAAARVSDADGVRIRARAEQLVRAVRENRVKKSGLDAFLQKYDLSSKEGVVLMCLAEALLRIPDAETADALIADKLTDANWGEHIEKGQPLFVNASTWGLMLTGRLVSVDPEAESDPGTYLKRLAQRIGEPVIRTALKQAMRIMGHQFVMGETIESALRRAAKEENRIYRYSFDMLGEAALTGADAQRYFDSYAEAIDSIGASSDIASVFAAPSISVKLSALHPRYLYTHQHVCVPALSERLRALAIQAKEQGIALTVDAEEADRLEILLAIFYAAYSDEALSGWEGLGLAVQVYQKRTPAVLSWLAELARRHRRRVPVRLVKGAYWDTEIKRGQEQGLSGYPVFTRKTSTDVSYLACAKQLFAASDALYPQFATHNARTAAHVLVLAGHGRDGAKDFEFQRLHGMGEELYGEIVGPDALNVRCRVYAPVGSHKDLLPYLVRRLLENGANTSFVNRIVDEKVPIEEIVQDPIVFTNSLSDKPHPHIPLPKDLYGEERRNSRGLNIADRNELEPLRTGIAAALQHERSAAPLVGGKRVHGEAKESIDPADTRRAAGAVVPADAETVERAVSIAAAAQPGWDATPASERAAILRRGADLFESHGAELIALCVREGGRSVPDSISELREAVDFLRYYAAHAERDFGTAKVLPGPTGESNELSLHGRGVFACISPWNFPLAIFTGQVSAALAAGNSVLAKPAGQTPLIGSRAIELLHEAGVPGDVLHFLPGSGRVIGGVITSDPRVAGVVFTGSTETARTINMSLAAREGPIATLIAETGGQNTMIVDSSALPEQVVLDVVASAFNSAGQRCSALRVLCLQEEIAPRVIELLEGHMRELIIGDPALLETDIGPVIDAASLAELEEHAARISKQGRVIYRMLLSAEHEHGTFCAPLAVEIDDIGVLEREVFGPILHVVRYKARERDALIDQINATGYGLTFGVHSRLDRSARQISERVQAGNAYVNRNMIGAVVGVQPFGGCGLSGTGPKAGGPYYLHRMATERTLTVNTSAVGGNATLLSLSAD